MSVQVIHGDSRAALEFMPSNSIDSVVTDPPYALVSISKRFGKPGSAPAQVGATGAYARASAGFMGKTWDTGETAFDPTFWAEVLRVLKPGGHVLAFGGTRTYHRLACAIEDAGFEIRDQIGWLYGSGFPKSHDMAKAIDQAGGMAPVEQAQLLQARRKAAGWGREELAAKVGCTASSIRDWEEGRSRSAGAPLEHIIPSKNYRLKLAELLGYSMDERRRVGAATDRRDDGTVYGLGHSGELLTGGHTPEAAKWKGWGTALKPAWEPIVVARKSIDGTNAGNLARWGVGPLNIDGCRVGGENGRWPANIIHDGSDEVIAGFPTEAGAAAPVRKRNGDKFRNTFGAFKGNIDEQGSTFRGDKGSAARFFYCAKASRADRDHGLDAFAKKRTGGMSATADGSMLTGSGNERVTTRANTHPTVKPTNLMRYLCRLVTPPGGTVLDPFMGSGSTGRGAVMEGFNFIGCELDADYTAIARARIAAVTPAPTEGVFA